MFRDAPEELPCTQHDQFAPIREAMVKSGMAKLVIAAAVIGMPNVKLCDASEAFAAAQCSAVRPFVAPKEK